MTRPLLISGFMGTGKTEVGQIVAERSAAKWIDLDQQVELSAGKSIAKIFQDEGELRFRQLEKDALRSILRSCSTPTVVSLGGGALLDESFRIEVTGRAVVATLSATPEEIVRRVVAEDQCQSRPLLQGDDALSKVRLLLAQRAKAYQEAHALIATDDKSPEQVAQEVLRTWQEDAVLVAAGDQSYVVRIGSGLIRQVLGQLVGSVSGTLLITDANVSPLHGEKARSALKEIAGKRAEVVLTPGEAHKNLAGLAQIFEGAFDANMDRKATFVGLGGGVVTDMTGFAAASWVRGVRWVGLPTTLLSMVDASVGGKTAVDFKTAKNSVGAFWQPAAVVCDVETLLTEKHRMYVGALSEVVKTALIGDRDLLSFLEDNAEAVLTRDLQVVQQIVERCVRVKAKVVALDEREAGVRATLNLGHTIGHALEASSGYTGLTHGEAVGLGLVAALRLGERRGHTERSVSARVHALLKRLGLKHALSRGDLEKCTALLGHDKKRAGGMVKFVYVKEAGEVFTESIELSELERMTPELADG